MWQGVRFFQPNTLLFVLSRMSAAQKWAQSSWDLDDAGSSALITSLSWDILVLLMYPKLLCEISKIGTIAYIQNWMLDTNTTLSVITVNEVSTLAFVCEYQTWLPRGCEYAWITASSDDTVSGALRWHALHHSLILKNKQNHLLLFALTTQI